VTSFIDDLANRRHLPTVIGWAEQGAPIPVERLQTLANGSARGPDIDRHGEHWARTLISLLERGGVGTLQQDHTGAHVLVPATRPPTEEEAWEAATGS